MKPRSSLLPHFRLNGKPLNPGDTKITKLPKQIGRRSHHRNLLFQYERIVHFAGQYSQSKLSSKQHPAAPEPSNSPYRISIFRAMADDASYNTFLTRANQDPMSGHHQADTERSSTSQARGEFDPSSTSSASSAIPAPLRNISATFVSETDSDFEPVFFSYASDALPNVDEFTKVLGVKGANTGKVEILSVRDWDPKGQYQDIVERVKQAGEHARGKRGESTDEGAKVFRVEVDESGTRVEYYILSVGDRSLVGVVAKAVES